MRLSPQKEDMTWWVGIEIHRTQSQKILQIMHMEPKTLQLGLIQVEELETHRQNNSV